MTSTRVDATETWHVSSFVNVWPGCHVALKNDICLTRLNAVTLPSTVTAPLGRDHHIACRATCAHCQSKFVVFCRVLLCLCLFSLVCVIVFCSVLIWFVMFCHVLWCLDVVIVVVVVVVVVVAVVVGRPSSVGRRPPSAVRRRSSVSLPSSVFRRRSSVVGRLSSVACRRRCRRGVVVGVVAGVVLILVLVFVLLVVVVVAAAVVGPPLPVNTMPLTISGSVRHVFLSFLWFSPSFVPFFVASLSFSDRPPMSYG